MNRTTITLPLASALTLIVCASTLGAQTLDTVRVASGLTDPLFVTAPPGDTTRLFIVEQGGDIEILKNGSILVPSFIDLTTKLNVSGNERGLLGLAFDPNYASNGFFYVNYTRAGDAATIVERYTVSGNPDIANPNSNVIIEGPISQPQNNHNGGCLQFGPDGMLYVGMGDGGNFNDTGSGHAAGGNAQSPSTLLGKMLRLDVNNPPTYIPANNPYVSDPNVPDEIWAFGLRNPWRFSFDRLTGDLYIGDVGQGAREEISFQPASSTGGENYGWRCMEGFNCTGLSGCTCNDASLTLPIDDYTHAGGNCSVTGGYVYNGCAIPGLVGTYFFADYCTGRMWSFEYVGGTVTNFIDRTAELAPGGGLAINNVSSFGEDDNGEIYICDLADGEVYRIVPQGAPDCNANGASDLCDIANGSSLDANSDSIPDECQCPIPPVEYCTPKVNSLLCSPSAHFSGAPNVTNAQPFLVTADQFINNKFGLLFYGFATNNAPFQGGTLCVLPPIDRTGVQSSGGSGSGSDCTGTYSFDFMTLILGGSDPNLVPGQDVYAQYWARDPQDAFTTSLSDAVSFTICN